MRPPLLRSGRRSYRNVEEICREPWNVTWGRTEKSAWTVMNCSESDTVSHPFRYSSARRWSF